MLSLLFAMIVTITIPQNNDMDDLKYNHEVKQLSDSIKIKHNQNMIFKARMLEKVRQLKNQS